MAETDPKRPFILAPANVRFRNAKTDIGWYEAVMRLTSVGFLSCKRTWDGRPHLVAS